mgnify:CR=1 FL=1
MRHLLCLLVCTLFLLAPARAEDFQVDGLDADSTAYASALRARNPAGLTPQNRRQMEQRATDAQRRNDWAGVASVLEAFAGTGNPPSDAWLALARAQLRRTPPDTAHAAQAAWRAFSSAEAGAGEIPSLLVLAEAADPGWRARLDGRLLPRRTAWGWAQGFVLPAGGGRFVLTYAQTRRHTALGIEAGLLMLVAVLAAPGGRRRRGLEDDDDVEQQDAS